MADSVFVFFLSQKKFIDKTAKTQVVCSRMNPQLIKLPMLLHIAGIQASTWSWNRSNNFMKSGLIHHLSLRKPV